ncbi:MAG TPA: glycosyltransferase family 39 protein [Ktedonobacteraceae bacterium]|nr:glycosyltransferase family 39 protein [Ktedonobacteraceae bacterium]
MSIDTIEDVSVPSDTRQKRWRWLRTAITLVIAVGLFLFALQMRLNGLGFNIERDYDEGVYWQSLRAMQTGHTLYSQIFYSQPPFFLLSIYPSFIAFGGTLWAGRLGIALVSLFGILGAFLLGKALRGEVGAIAALALLVVDPIYLVESQVLQAEVPSAAFAMLTIGFAYLWWEHPEGRKGWMLAGLTGLTLALSILGKLLMVSTLVPLGLLLLARLVIVLRRPISERWQGLLPLIIAIAVAVIVSLLFLLPFVISAPKEFYHQVITFHTQAAISFANSQVHNPGMVQNYLTMTLTLAATYGTIVSLIRRDWRVLPLLAWFAVTAILLIRQVPVFQHHFIAFSPPLIALAICGIGPFPLPRNARSTVTLLASVMALVLIAISIMGSVKQDRVYAHKEDAAAINGYSKYMKVLASDLDHNLQPGGLVITDSQFIAALGNRDTPPELVDTSGVRGRTGYLTGEQLLAVGQKENVGAVLIFPAGRLRGTPDFNVFYTWVKANFHLAHKYKDQTELWAR